MDECQRLLNYKALTPSPGSWSVSCEIEDDEDTQGMMSGLHSMLKPNSILALILHNYPSF